MTRHRGSTLVELMLSMGAGSAVMLLGISLVHQTMTLNSKSNKGADRNRTLDQLAHCFRRDSHWAEEVRLLSASSLTMQSRDGSVITYLAEGSLILRQRTDTVAKDEHERFVLDEGSTAHFAMLPNPERASLMVSKDLGLSDTPPRVELMVETVVGRWQILERNAQGTTK